MLKPILLALIVAALLAPAASAEAVTLTFQGIGLTTQDIDVFDASGQYLFTTNSTATIGLNVSESPRYTFQLKPQPTTVDPVNLINYLITWLTDHIVIVLLLIILLIAVGTVFRK